MSFANFATTVLPSDFSFEWSPEVLTINLQILLTSAKAIAELDSSIRNTPADRENVTLS